MQREKAVLVFDRDLKEAISDVKKDGYRKALLEAQGQVVLKLIEREIRSDFRLTRIDRLELLAEVALASA